MTKVIVYKTKEGGMAILTPVTGSGLTLDQIASKDVPKGLPYKIVDRSVIDDLYATQGYLRDAWEVDESQLTDGIGGPEGNQ